MGWIDSNNWKILSLLRMNLENCATNWVHWYWTEQQIGFTAQGFKKFNNKCYRPNLGNCVLKLSGSGQKEREICGLLSDEISGL